MSQAAEKTLSPAQKSLVSLLTRAVFRPDFQPEAAEDWDAVLREAELQSVFPLAYRAAGELLPAGPGKAWRSRFMQHISHNMNVINAHHEAHELLSAAGIPYTVIKGCASAFYYPEPELRTMGDVDLYVERENLERVRALYEQLGVRAEGLDHPHHWSFTQNGVELELHWVPSGIPAADDGSILGLFRDLLERSRVETASGGELALPDPFHHGLILLLHTANHMTAGGVGLRHLLDWLAFENSLPEQDFRALFEPTLRRIGLWSFACALSAVGVRYFGCREREFCAGLPPELARGLLMDFFAGGNFGVKNKDRLNQSKLLRDNASRQIQGRGELKHLLRFMNQRARAQYPPAARHGILLPIGWLRVLRNRKRAIRAGKQAPLRLGDTLRGAREREALYEQLRLFEE